MDGDKQVASTAFLVGRDYLVDFKLTHCPDGFGGAVVSESPFTPLAPARRKALTLAFARLAAMRAMG